MSQNWLQTATCRCLINLLVVVTRIPGYQDKPATVVSFNSQCSWWSLCSIHLLQAFWWEQPYCSPDVEYPRKSHRWNPQEEHNTNKIQRVRLSIFFYTTCKHIYYKDILKSLTNFKHRDYVHMYMLNVVLFQRTVLQYNEKFGEVEIKKIKNYMIYNFKLSIFFNKEGKGALFFDLESSYLSLYLSLSLSLSLS